MTLIISTVMMVLAWLVGTRALFVACLAKTVVSAARWAARKTWAAMVVGSAVVGILFLLAAEYLSMAYYVAQWALLLRMWASLLWLAYRGANSATGRHLASAAGRAH